MQTDLSAADNLEAGRILDGRFKVLSKLGQGGMGIVYEAQHLDMKRGVALKLLRAELGLSPEKLERFKNEARVVSALDHPHILRVYSVGITEDGQPYIAMEMLRGAQLSDLIAEGGPVPWKEALPWFIQTVSALCYAHENSIIHRDIKPSNIMLVDASDGNAERAIKLVDFGIAKSLLEGAPQLTKTEMLLGSVFYMSPGQMQGRSADVRSDVYSLGCTFYEILTGVPPFVGDTIYDTIVKQTSEQASPIAQVNPNANVPDDLAYLIDWMMQKQAVDRPQTMTVVQDALRQIAEGVPLERQELRKYSGDAGGKNSRTRNKRFVSVMAFLSMVAVAGVAAFYSFADHANQLLRRGSESNLRQGVVLPAKSDEEARILESLKDGRSRDVPPWKIADELSGLAKCYRDSGRFVDCQVVLERAIRFAKENSLKSFIPTLELQLGSAYVVTGRFDDAEKQLKASAADVRTQRPFQQQIELAEVYLMTRRYDNLIALIQPGMAGLSETTEPSANKFLDEVIEGLCFRGKYDEADAMLKRAKTSVWDPETRAIQQAEVDSIVGLSGHRGKVGARQLDSIQAKLGKSRNYAMARYHLARARTERAKGNVGTAMTFYNAALYELIFVSGLDPSAVYRFTMLNRAMQVAEEYLQYTKQASPQGTLDVVMRLGSVRHDCQQAFEACNDRSKVPAYLLNHEYLP